MTTKTEQLQIRVAPRQKALLKRRAAAAGLDVSSYVLARALPPESARFASLIRALSRGTAHQPALAELNDFLSTCTAGEFTDAVELADVASLSLFLQNYIAAMVEHAAYLKRVEPPAWTQDVVPLDAPYFAAPLASLRPHLLRSAPVAFKRRNIFVDASVGDRV